MLLSRPQQQPIAMVVRHQRSLQFAHATQTGERGAGGPGEGGWREEGEREEGDAEVGISGRVRGERGWVGVAICKLPATASHLTLKAVASWKRPFAAHVFLLLPSLINRLMPARNKR